MLCVSLPAAALLIRDDRDDAEYRELASRYTSAAALASPDGEGALVAPAWVLTSGTFARALEAKRGATVMVAGKARRVAGIFTHPKAREHQPEDIALLRLRDAVTGVEPVRLYRKDDEAGQGLVFVAHGATGRIGTEARTRDGAARAAINTIERLTPLSLAVVIKGQDDASDLQGVLVAGEEGAPAYIEAPEGIFLAGLYYGDGGTANLFSRLSAFLPWVEATMVGSERDEMRRMLGDEAR